MRIEEAEERARQVLAALDLGVAFAAEPGRVRKVRAASASSAEAPGGLAAAAEPSSPRPIVRASGVETERARQEEWLYRRHRLARTGWNRD